MIIKIDDLNHDQLHALHTVLESPKNSFAGLPLVRIKTASAPEMKGERDGEGPATPLYNVVLEVRTTWGAGKAKRPIHPLLSIFNVLGLFDPPDQDEVASAQT